MPNIRCKNMMFVQNLSHLTFNNLEELITHVEKVVNPTRYAGILHDNDVHEDGTPKAEHIHLIMQFKNARSIDSIAKHLDSKPEFINQWKGEVNNGYSYLIHRNASAASKYQYPVTDVRANFDYEKLIQTIGKQVDASDNINAGNRINVLLDQLYTGEITKSEVESTLTGSQYARAKAKIETVCQKRMEILADEWREKMRTENTPVSVLWIYGTTGTCKTRIAKDYAQQYNEDYFLSGSSRDPFQHYQGQHIVILDELRPAQSQFDYSDLLKMLDPYNDEAMAASRYFDKPLTANVFIITSPYDPCEFFKELSGNKFLNAGTDKFNQLLRRLTLVQHMTEQEIELMNFDTIFQRFIADPATKKPNPYLSATQQPPPQRKDALNIYNRLTEQILAAVTQKPCGEVEDFQSDSPYLVNGIYDYD